MRKLIKFLNIKKPTPNRFSVRKTLIYSACISALFLSTKVLANNDEIPTSLTLDKAITLSLKRHPDLSTFVHRMKVSEGLIQQASIHALPEIYVNIEDAMGSGDLNGFSAAETTLSITWVLDDALVDQRIAVANSQSQILLIEKNIKALDIAAETAELFIKGLVLEQRLGLVKLSQQQAKRVLYTIQKRVKVGRSTNVDKLLADAQLARTQMLVEDIQHQLFTVKYQLSSHWIELDGFEASQSTPQFPKLEGNLLHKPQYSELTKQFSKLKSSPSVKRFATQQRIAESEIELAKLTAKPLWKFNTGIRHSFGNDSFGLVAGVSIPWGGENRNAGKIKALRQKQAEFSSMAESAVRKLDAQLYALLQEFNHTLHVIENLSLHIIPVLEQAQNEAERAYSIGKYSYLEWTNVQKDLISAQSELLDAYEAMHLGHIEIQRLTGTSLN